MQVAVATQATLYQFVPICTQSDSAVLGWSREHTVTHEGAALSGTASQNEM